MRAGLMRESLVIQTPAPAISVTSITRSSTTATATASGHGFSSNDYVTIAGASPSGYNGRVKVTVTGASTFTYTVSSGLSTPATGTITATHTSNAQGGAVPNWTTLATVPAEHLAKGASEGMQARAVISSVLYRFRIRRRADVLPKMRALWTPTWPPSASQQTLEINGVYPDDRDLGAQVLECAVSQ